VVRLALLVALQVLLACVLLSCCQRSQGFWRR
jgi:predicted small secreted protein